MIQGFMIPIPMTTLNILILIIRDKGLYFTLEGHNIIIINNNNSNSNTTLLTIITACMEVGTL